MLAALTLPRDAWVELAPTRASGPIFLSTPFDLDSAELLAELGVPALKTGSGELTNVPFLRALAARLPLLISTGMSNWEEVDAAVAATRARPDRAVPLRLGLSRARGGVQSPGHPGDAERTPCRSAGRTTRPDSRRRSRATRSAPAPREALHLRRTAPGPDHAASLEPEQLPRTLPRSASPRSLSGTASSAASPARRRTRRWSAGAGTRRTTSRPGRRSARRTSWRSGRSRGSRWPWTSPAPPSPARCRPVSAGPGGSGGAARSPGIKALSSSPAAPTWGR